MEMGHERPASKAPGTQKPGPTAQSLGYMGMGSLAWRATYQQGRVPACGNKE
jgi:hypothetical protein